MTRKEALALVWKHTHRDYKGKLADGTKAIMTFRRGTVLVPLEGLTDEEIQHALPREKRTPTPAQLAALKAFAAKYGHTWRTKLNDAWLLGRDASEPGGHLLRQLRNTLGPSWLASFKLETMRGD